MWFKKNKWKVIIAVIIIAVLAAAFYFGGNAPGSKGWVVDDGHDSAAVPTDAIDNPSPEETPEPTQEMTPEPEAEITPEVTPEVTPELTVTPLPPSETPVPTEEPILETPQPTMEINPETGMDKYLTAPVPEGKPLPVEPQDVVIGSTAYTCTLSISCSTILNNMELCDPDKTELVPEDGWILMPTVVTFYEGESVFNVLQRVCKQLGIHMEYEDTPIYNSAYIEGIHNLYEFDVGELSGWMYKVNSWFPNYGCSRYQLRDGDVICWVYTCDLGQDVGGGYSTGNGRG